MKRLVIIAILLGFATAQAAISFGPAGTGVITFDSRPATNEWTTLSIAGSADSVFTAAALDAAVQMNTAGSFTNALLIDTGPGPIPHTLGGWSSTRLAVYTGPAGVTAEMLMATLRNDSGVPILLFQVAYDFDVTLTNSFSLEEIPGHRVYFSLTGDAYSWQFVPNLSGTTIIGPRNAVLDLFATPWHPGTPLYLLWVQDNASHSPDSCYLIDNFYAGPEPPPPPCFLTHPASTTAVEGESVTLSASACSSPPFYYQWFKNGAPIAGARDASYVIPRVRFEDAGAYFVVLSNSINSARSATATLTVVPDQEPPRAVLAYLVEDTNSILDTIVVFFSERVETNSAGAVGNYYLRPVAPGGRLTFLDASMAGETAVVLHLENLAPGVAYLLGVSNVTDQSGARHVLSPNPTILPLQSFGPPMVAADHAWKYCEAPPNGTWPDWMNPGFDDTAWPIGPGAFGLPFDEIIPPPFVVRTLIRTPDIGGPVTTYFRTSFDLPAANTNAMIQLSGVFDEGAIVYLNGTEQWRVRLPNGPVTTSTLASNAVEPHVLAGPRDVYAPGALRPGANWLAVELHQVSFFSGDAIMGLTLRLSQPMVCIPALAISRSESNSVSVNWSCGGTLQASPTPGGPLESWRDVVTQTNSFTTNLTAGALFFRVRL